MEYGIILYLYCIKMFSNKGQNQQQQQRGGFHMNTHTPSSSRHSTKRSSKSRSPRKPHPFQNQAELQRVMSLFQ